MTFVHEAIPAWPVTGSVDKAASRAMFTRRFAYCLGPDENPGSLVAADPATGVLPLYLIQNNVSYQLDPLDSTTAAGATCLVTSDSKRYKSDTIAYPWSVLDKDTTEQPEDPTVGDRYIIPVAATGDDWAGHDGKIGIYTPGGWRFAAVPIGRFVYVEDETGFYHRNAAGTWTAGIGSIALGAGSINITHVLGAKASFVVKVENQTTNTAPASPVAPVAYIVGPVPTGAWSAYSPGDLAICLVDGAWTRIVPATGDQVFDKALAIPVEWRGTAWVSAAGVLVGFKSIARSATTNTTATGGTTYSYNNGTPPIDTDEGTKDDDTITYTAKVAGVALLFSYRCRGVGVDANSEWTFGLFRDAITNAIDWTTAKADASSIVRFSTNFIVAAPDAIPHTYYVKAFRTGTSNVTLSRRLFTVSETTVAPG